ncbi:MAG: DUF58 domain-containing protein [Planctomycetaceae bacterium]|nr:DUF58 domain-containing protein [Planctomycetaceae bacterium]
MSETPTPPIPQDPTQLAQFGSLELIARQLVEGLLMGRHRSPYKGSSVEFVEHREYYPGDEIRHIDWRAYGKTNRYYVKEFEDETNVRAHLIVDCSSSMAYAGSTLSKFSYARMLAASLAWLLLNQRDAVGLVTFDSAIRSQVKPSSNRNVFRQIEQHLQQEKTESETSIASVLESLLPTLARRSLLILISDCFDSVDDLVRALQRCRHARHEVIVFRIAAPEEEEFPFERPTQFRNIEQQNHRILVDPLRLRREYLRLYREFAEELSRQCGMLNVGYKRLLTTDPLQSALGSWLAERDARR